MSAISLKSITGITSITSPAAPDNQITLHTQPNTVERLRIDSSGRLLIGTTTEGHGNADDLTIATTDHTGITLRSATNRNGSVFFSDGTSGADEYRGWIQYTHTSDYLTFGTAANEGLRITSTGLLQGTSYQHDGGLELLSSNNNQSTRLRIQSKSSGGTAYNWYLDSARSVDRFTIHDGTTSWFTILGTGKVGINNTSPSNALDVQAGTTNTAIVARSTDAKAQISLLDNSTTSVGSVAIGAEGDALFLTSGSAGAEALRIASTGQVQINRDGGSAALTLGASQDFRLYHDAGGPTIFSDNNNQGLKLQIKDLNLTEYTGATTKLKIDSSYRILKGLTTARGNFANNTSGVEYGVQIEGTSAIAAGLSIIRNSNDANDGGIVLGKTRATSNGGNTVVQAGDDLGNITFAGSDGTTLQFGAEIFAEVQSGVGNDDLPTDLIFKTNAGSTSTSESLRIKSTGQISAGGGGTAWGNALLSLITPSGRSTSFDASDGDTWHDMVIKNTSAATDNAVGLAFEITGNAYHKNAGTGICAVKNGTNSDYGADLVFITRPQSAVAEERLRITSNGNLLVNQTAEFASAVKLSVRGASSALSDGGQIFDITTTAAASGGTRLAFGVNEDNYTWIRSYESGTGSRDLVFSGVAQYGRFDSSGRLIIGDTANTNAHANGDDLIVGNTSSGKRTGITIVSANDQNGQLLFSDGTSSGNANIQGQIVYEHSSNYMALYTTAVERLRITSVGEVIISPRTGGSSNNRTSIHFNNNVHSPYITFKSNNLTEAAHIFAAENSGGCDLQFKTKNTSGTSLSRLTLKNNGEIVTHQLAGSEKGYPLVMGTGTVAQNTNMSGSFNYHDVRGVHTTGGPNYHIGGWVFLGNDQAAAPYPVRRFQIAKPGGFSNGTIVYQIWHNGDSNYDYGGLFEVRINCWTGSSRFESVSIRCVNGKRDDVHVVAYNDTKGIMVQPSSIWGQMFIRRAGYDDGGRNPGSSYCAVANNGALAIYNSSGTDDGTPPSGGFNLYAFGTSDSSTHTGGRDIENSNSFPG